MNWAIERWRRLTCGRGSGNRTPGGSAENIGCISRQSGTQSQGLHEFEDRDFKSGLLHLNGKGDAGLSARGDDRRNCYEDSFYAVYAQDAVLAGEVARISENCAPPWVRH